MREFVVNTPVLSYGATATRIAWGVRGRRTAESPTIAQPTAPWSQLPLSFV
jgi:hypothetical protein